MNRSFEQPLNPPAKRIGWAGLSVFVLLHLIPYANSYAVPHYDLYNVMHVINYLKSPELFSGDRLTLLLSQMSIKTAPVYFYGVTYPLSFVLSAKWVVLTIGAATTLASSYLAGLRWTRWRNLLTSCLVTILILHSELPTIEGNRRSFTAFFILALFWLEERDSFVGELFLVGLAAGIYPPAALLILTYFCCGVILQNNTIGNIIYKTFSYAFVFVVVLMPYWLDLLFIEEAIGTTDMSNRVTYNFSSIQGWTNTVLVGDQGALFREQLHLGLFVSFLSLLILERLVLKNRFVFRLRYKILLTVGLLLWGSAHVVHPLIYHPFKYTRMTLLLVPLLIFAENLPTTVKKLHHGFRNRSSLRFLLYLGGTTMLMIWVGFAYVFAGTSTSGFLGILPTIWKFILGLPVFLSLVIGFPVLLKSQILRAFVGATTLMMMLFLPHNTPQVQWRDMRLSNFSEMYTHLRKSPPGTLVAGPPAYFLDPIPAFAKRGVFSSTNKSVLTLSCERTKKFWRIYFEDDPEAISKFMKDNGINYLLVDRRLLQQMRTLGHTHCVGKMGEVSDPVLDQHFPEASWHFKRRFYLLHRDNLKDLSAEKPSVFETDPFSESS